MFYAAHKTSLTHVDGVEIYTLTGKWIVRDSKYDHSPYKPSLYNGSGTHEEALKLADRLNVIYKR